MRYSIFYSIFCFWILFNSSACFFSNNSNSEGLGKKNDYLEKLIGLWKVEEENNKYFISISSDSIVNMYSHETPASMLLKITSMDAENMQMVELTDEPSGNSSGGAVQILKERKYQGSEKLEYSYSVNDGVLRLVKKDTENITVAKNCKTGICDLQRDFFRKIPLEIDLCINNKGTPFGTKISDTKIYIGKPIDRYKHVYGDEERLWIDDRMSDGFNVLKSTIDKKTKYRASHRVIIFADKNTSMEGFVDACLLLYADDIENVFIGTRINTDVSKPLKINLLKVEKERIDGNELEIETLDEWLNKK